MAGKFVTVISIALVVISLAAMGCSTGKSDVRETPAAETSAAPSTLPTGLSTESDRWEVYGRYGALNPQIVVVDAGLEADKLANYLPQLVRVRVPFANANPNGMPDRQALR